MGNQLNTNIVNPENYYLLNENIKFQNQGKLIIPISKLMVEISEMRESYGADSYETALIVVKGFLTKYPIIFSFTKKCYWILLDVFEDEVAYLICEFIKENTPKKYIHWNYEEFKLKHKFNSTWCSSERIERMNEIFTKNYSISG